MKATSFFFVYLIFGYIHCSNHTIDNLNQNLIHYLIKYYSSSRYDITNGIIPDYPYGSYIRFRNPILIKFVEKKCKNFEYFIYIVGINEKENESIIKPYTISLIEKNKKILTARFRFYIDEHNEATIYATSFFAMQTGFVHKRLLNAMENFLNEKNITVIKNMTICAATDAFFTQNCYTMGIKKLKE